MSADPISRFRRSSSPQRRATIRPERAQAGRAWPGALLGFAVALAVRALSWRDVFEADRVVFAGNDAYYHARRAFYGAQNFPDLLRSDAYLNFPHGGQPIWPPLFDGALALLLRGLDLAPSDDPRAAETLLAWIPALLGAACVAAVFCLTRTLFGTRAAWLAALLLAVLPAHSRYSELGFLDHHAAVALAAVLLLAAALALLTSLSRSPEPGGARASPGRAAALGIAIGASLALWPGMLLHVALVDLGLAAFALTQTRPQRAARVAAHFSLAHAAALLVVVPFCWNADWQAWSAFSPVVLSGFQPALLFGVALGFGLYSLLCHSAATLTPGGRAGRALLATALVLGLAALLVPDPGAALAEAWTWFAKGETFQSEVAESKPLFQRAGQLDFGRAERSLSRLVYLVPVLLAVSWWAAGRAPGAAARRVLVAWAAGMFAATALQMRFFNSFSVAFCPLLGWWIARTLEALTARTRAARGRRALARAALGAALLFALHPSLASHAPDLRNQRLWLEGRPALQSSLAARKRLLLDLADWLRENTPQTSGYSGGPTPPEYAVLSLWADGHVLEYTAQRPTVVDNFGDDLGAQNFALAERYFVAPEPEAVAIAKRLGIRYVIAEQRRLRSRADYGPDAMISLLYFSDGEERARGVQARSGVPREIDVPVAALEHHRLVFETAPKPQTNGTRPGFKLYEVVAGARLKGTARPGARIEARLQLETNRGRRFEYRTSTTADARGHYALRLPYATRDATESRPDLVQSPVEPCVRPVGRWTLSIDRGHAEFDVREADVQNGAWVSAPQLPPSPSSGIRDSGSGRGRQAHARAAP